MSVVVIFVCFGCGVVAGVIAELALKNREDAENRSTLGVLTDKERTFTELETSFFGWIDRTPFRPRMVRPGSGMAFREEFVSPSWNG